MIAINKKILFLFLFLSFCQIAFSQRKNNKQNNISSEIQLANKYYSEKDYEKAAILFKEIYETTNYSSYRDLYLRCLFNQKDYKIAEEYIKKEIRKNSSDFFLKINLGITLSYQNRKEEADKCFTEVINIAKKNQNNTNSVANTFINYKQYDYAQKMYEQAEKELSINFDNELGTLFYIQRDYKNMMEKYCSVLKDGNEITLSNIQSRLQFIIASDIDDNISEIIETVAIKELQRQPSNTNLIKLLFWLYSQTGKNKQALNQLIALDKRTEQQEKDILEFAKMLKNNKEYNLAQEAVNYIIKKGKNNNFYFLAEAEATDIKFKTIITEKNPSTTSLKEIEAELSKENPYISKKESFDTKYNLIVLKAYYLNKYDEAINLADTLIKEKYFSKEQQEKLKMLLGDIYLISGNQWDATLCYAQIENTAKESPIGHEARFKKAKLAYFIGQFKWAQAQLNILKTSTSKLIANDALELSSFISENYDFDTSENTMKTFASADFLIFSKNYEKAIITLDSIFDNYKISPLIDDALYRKAFIYKEIGQEEQAAKFYEKIFTEYQFDILADNALFYYAVIQNNLKKYDEADEALFRLISEYPNSIFAVEARNILRSKGSDRKIITDELYFWNNSNFYN